MQPESENNNPSQPTSPSPQLSPQPQPQPSPSAPDSSRQVISGGGLPTSPVSPSKNSRLNFKNKKFLIGGVIAVVVLLSGSALAYFGVYVPNQPENVWNRALKNTAKGYDKLVEEGKEEKAKGGNIKGNFNMDIAGTVADGNIESKFYEKDSTTKVDFGAAGQRINAEILTTSVQGVNSPDVYVKLTGLKGIDALLGSESAGVGSLLATLDNQWYVIDHTLFDQLQKSATAQSSSLPELTRDDYIKIAEEFGKVNREYLFTEDKSKAVFTVAENIGKEKVDNRDSYHYKVGYNKDNLKAYVGALKEAAKNTKLKDYLKDEEFKALEDDISKLDGNDKADVWVDLKTKLIRKVRITDKANKNTYADFGLDYTGGDEYPFTWDVVDNESDKSQGKFNLRVTFNSKDNSWKFKVGVDGKENDQTYKFNLDSTLTPSNEKVEVKKPDGAKSILEAYSQLLGGADPQALFAPSSSMPVDDTEL